MTEQCPEKECMAGRSERDGGRRSVLLSAASSSCTLSDTVPHWEMSFAD